MQIHGYQRSDRIQALRAWTKVKNFFNVHEDVERYSNSATPELSMKQVLELLCCGG